MRVLKQPLFKVWIIKTERRKICRESVPLNLFLSFKRPDDVQLRDRQIFSFNKDFKMKFKDASVVSEHFFHDYSTIPIINDY